jgi:kynurenine formamidase
MARGALPAIRANIPQMIRTVSVAVLAAVAMLAQAPPQGWTKGKGYGWVYGKSDEIGALNAIRSPESVLRALRSVRTGRVYDLGVRVDRTSYKWPGHSPMEVMSFRSPAGLKVGQDIAGFGTGDRNLAFHSCALFLSDNAGTQIDGLGHITKGADNHWYNDFRESDYGSDFGILRADADTIPPVIGRAVLIDVAGWKNVDALPSNFPIGQKELEAALAAQRIDVEPGDIVLIRTGTLRYWGETGADHAKLAQYDSAGLTLGGAKWLVEQKGAVALGSDTSGLEVRKDPTPGAISDAVHEYLLVDQGVHILEFHNLEDLARGKVNRFVYVGLTNRIKGAVAGTALRPVAIE